MFFSSLRPEPLKMEAGNKKLAGLKKKMSQTEILKAKVQIYFLFSNLMLLSMKNEFNRG